MEAILGILLIVLILGIVLNFLAVLINFLPLLLLSVAVGVGASIIVHVVMVHGETKRSEKGDPPIFTPILAAPAAAGICLAIAYASGGFDVATFLDDGRPPSPDRNVFFTGILALFLAFCGGVAWRFSGIWPEHGITRPPQGDHVTPSVSAHPSASSPRLDWMGLPRMGELQSVQHALDELHQKLGVTSRDNFVERIKARCGANSEGVLPKRDTLAVYVAKALKQAKKDKVALERACALYASAVALCDGVKPEVHQLNDQEFIEYFNKLYTALYSDNLKQLIDERQWGEFCDVVSEVQDYFRALREEIRTADREMPLERAYDILNVRPTDPDEEIKKAYWRLAHVWHPDHADEEQLAAGDRQMKDLNRAYKVVKEERQKV